jgi:2-oxoacid:acceptor oxidoreductase gamma subunit (pyruvate/2-ketoisovalerate family)
MLQIRIHGRGGQGAQVACQILAAAFFRAGREVQAFASYGGERRGAPVTAFLRVDDRPLRLRCEIERADHLIVLDPVLLADIDPASLHEHGVVVVNAPAALCGRGPLGARVVEVDAGAIAARAGLGPIVGTAMLGAFAAATGLLSLDDLRAAVADGSPARQEANVSACVAAYLAVAGAIVSPRPPALAGG